MSTPHLDGFFRALPRNSTDSMVLGSGSLSFESFFCFEKSLFFLPKCESEFSQKNAQNETVVL